MRPHKNTQTSNSNLTANKKRQVERQLLKSNNTTDINQLALALGKSDQTNELYTLWQFGDWTRLAEISIQSEIEEECTVLKACAQLQLGKAQQAKNVLKDLPLPLSEQATRLLISGVFNTLGKAQGILNQQHQAEARFIQSIQLVHPHQSSLLIYKARIREQYAQLNLPDPFHNYYDDHDNDIKSYMIEDTKSQHFNQDMTITFWLKIHNWPDKWTNIVSKTDDDAHNEFCLRLKNEDQGQWYYGDNNKAIILNNWTPKKHIRCNEWVHIAVVKIQNEYSRVYIDGLISSSRDIHGLPPAKSNDEYVELMGQLKTNTNLDGVIVGLKLHNSAFSSEQIVQSMTRAVRANTLSISHNYYNSRQQVLSPLDEIDFQQIKQQKYQTAKNLRALDYYWLIDRLKNKQKLNIVIVGANDGKTNDPIYNYIYQNSQTTQVMLIEPQQAILPYLEENYSFHSNAKVINCALGEASELTLYSIKPEYWPKLNVPYAQDRGWPIYRAPTGVSSSNKEHVENWLKKHLDTSNIEDAIEKIYVPCKRLKTILDEYNINRAIDVLQIDTEGFDDYVIYHSDIEFMQPKIIHFESAHLPENKKSLLLDYLEQRNYQIYEVEEDTLALINTINWHH